MRYFFAEKWKKQGTLQTISLYAGQGRLSRTHCSEAVFECVGQNTWYARKNGRAGGKNQPVTGQSLPASRKNDRVKGKNDKTTGENDSAAPEMVVQQEKTFLHQEEITVQHCTAIFSACCLVFPRCPGIQPSFLSRIFFSFRLYMSCLSLLIRSINSLPCR
jgi:hypothetical protein